MKLFYQLKREEQDAAVDHCADLVVMNAINHGLRIEVSDDEGGHELKARIDNLLKTLSEQTELESKEEKIQFLMSDQIFADTIFELAAEMAHNAFYHDHDELVLFPEDLLDGVKHHVHDDDVDDDEDDAEDAEDLMMPQINVPRKKDLLN